MRLSPLLAILPGLAACLAVTAGASAIAAAERAWLGTVWLETLVVAIVAGAALRTLLGHRAVLEPGLRFAAKPVLELAVVLLGFSVSAQVVAGMGPALIGGIAAIVAACVMTGYGLGRVLGLPHRMAMLVACGNAICGNSAIAAVAPVIGAAGEDVAASIGFTAVLGVAVVLLLPLAAAALHLTAPQTGMFAGLTVYAVPQVLAAAAPAGPVAVQIGTVVKLVRVLMLGPVVFVLGLARAETRDRSAMRKLVPPFILAFCGACLLRSLGVVPPVLLAPFGVAAHWLTVVAMAALGLGVDVRMVGRSGLRVTAAVLGSLLALTGLSLALIGALPA